MINSGGSEVLYLISAYTYPCQGGRPPLMAGHTYDVDAAQHLLADHADRVIVAFDHDATDPRVFIYTQTPDGVLSPGDYYLWPLLHESSERIKREIGELASSEGRSVGYYDHRRLHKWCRRLPLLTTLIRIRKATVQALCEWELTNSRPDALTVINTDRDLTGLTAKQTAEL